MICDECKQDRPKLRYVPQQGWSCADCVAATDKDHGPTVFVKGAKPRPGYDTPVVKRRLY